MINKRILIPSTHTFKNIHFEITRPSKRKIKFDVCVPTDGDQGECSSCVIFRVCALYECDEIYFVPQKDLISFFLGTVG